MTMKIAWVIERMDTGRGGRETSTAQIAAALARRGQEVTILCQSGRWTAPGVRVCPLGTRGLLRARRLANFVADVRHHLAEHRYDVVHATLPVPGAGVYQPRSGTVPAQRAASLRRRSALEKVFVVPFLPLNLPRLVAGRLESAVVADSKVFCLAVSQMVAEEFQRYYSRSERVRVVYNGVDVPDADESQRADWRQQLRFRMKAGSGDTVFLAVAKNFALKGVAETIEAFARWHHARKQPPSARLVVVGQDIVEGYQRHASLRDVGSQVLFVPPTEDIFSWYSAADACILLSWYDPCSRVVLEAVRWGLPAITTAYNGAAEALRQGAGIVVASPRDARGVAAALEEMSDPQRRARYAEGCRRIAQRLSVDRHVDELMQVYAEVAVNR